MHQSQQTFTFVDVNASKKTNTQTIKRHVSNQTNRRKRQAAVTQYQKAILEAAEQSSTGTRPPYIPESASTKQQIIGKPKQSSSPEPSSITIDGDDGDREFTFYKQLIERQPAEISNYWPAYQEWALRHLELPSTSRKKPSANIGTRGKSERLVVSLGSSHVLVSLSNQHITLHIPRISDPTEFSRMQWALKTCRDYIYGTYESTWAPVWQQRQWFQGAMLSLGTWRETFSLAMEFIQWGKLKEAFFLLNAAFNVTPAFFKQNHPGLLIALLGAMMYTCQINDERLSKLIRSHITQLSMAHLGPRHPISVCLREQLRAASVAHGQTDLLSLAVLDTFADVFGPSHTVSLSMRFGYVRRQLNSGEYDPALAALDLLEKHWNAETMPGSQLPKFLGFERAKVMQAKGRADRKDGPICASGLLELAKVADMSLELPVFVPGHGPVLQTMHSEILRKLGKYLLFGSHYALALHFYSRLHETLSPESSVESYSNPNGDPDRLPHIVARVLVDHVREEMAETAEGRQS